MPDTPPERYTAADAAAAAVSSVDVARVRRRTIWVLSLGQVLGGVAYGATIALGAVLATEISGDEAFSGLATAFVILGAAALAVPLATFAQRRDLTMNLVGATGAMVAGLVLGQIGFGGLAWCALAIVVIVVALSPMARQSPMAQRA